MRKHIFQHPKLGLALASRIQEFEEDTVFGAEHFYWSSQEESIRNFGDKIERPIIWGGDELPPLKDGIQALETNFTSIQNIVLMFTALGHPLGKHLLYYLKCEGYEN